MKRIFCAMSIIVLTIYMNAQVIEGVSKPISVNIQKINNKAIKYTTEENTNTEIASEPGRYYALIIGVSDYQDRSVVALDNPVKDAVRMYKILTELYSFDTSCVTLIKNATNEQIIIAFDNLTDKITPNDNLLIFYAGHGYWNEKMQVGYWIPADATASSTVNWFRNSTLKDYISGIKSKHTLLISDACFAGAIFKTRAAFQDADIAIHKLYQLPSRKAMTSGTLTEVPDNSVFIQYLIKRLMENNDKYLSSQQLFSSMRIAVMNNSNTVPQYGEIKDSGDEGGDFIFIKRDN